MLQGKNVVVGVCGGIAAYKAAEVVSGLRKLGANIDVIMTENAVKFVSPLTFRTISRNPVITDMFAEPGEWNVRHVSVAQKANLILAAPATANLIGKVAAGIADDMLTTTIMATRAPVLFVPAMNCNMYENAIVQENIARLTKLGYYFMEPDTGMLAEGSPGKGRLPEPQAIINRAADILLSKRDMHGIRVLITAGPTREAIDPVRYITNRSSGKMGYALASAAVSRGARVKLVSGPVALQKPNGVEAIFVNTADEMYKAALENFKEQDVLIFAAAVADYKCKHISVSKIKKDYGEMTLELVRTPDIAKELGKWKENRIHVGFSAETGDLPDNAKAKLKSKNLDLIAANDVTAEGAGFETDTNIVKIFSRDGSLIELPLMKKTEAAHRILDEVVKLIAERERNNH